MLICWGNIDIGILVQVMVLMYGSGNPRFISFYMKIGVWIRCYINRRVKLSIVSEIRDQYERRQFWNFGPLRLRWRVGVGGMSSLELISLLALTMIFLGPLIVISDSSPEKNKYGSSRKRRARRLSKRWIHALRRNDFTTLPRKNETITTSFDQLIINDQLLTRFDSGNSCVGSIEDIVERL